MLRTATLDTDHKDVIHDIAFDFYGKRMATCSTDQVIKIWNMADDGKWSMSGKIKSHQGSVWKVTWAHPEFGSILATCAFDKACTVYEEAVSEVGHGMQQSWVKRCTLADARGVVMDVRFAPKKLGLVLATCTSDGNVQIYEAYDVMNLSHFTNTHNITTTLPSCSCLSWNPSVSSLCPAMIAVGSDDCWTAMGSAVTSTARVALLAFDDKGNEWKQVESLGTVKEPVHDIAFAPNPGRSYHTLAIASKVLSIITIHRSPDEAEGLILKSAGTFTDHGNHAWHVSWNVTGTVLSATGDSGKLKIYRANYQDVWKCVSTLSSSFNGEQSGIGSEDQERSGKPSRNTAKFISCAPSHPSHVPWH